ncbi:PAS domain-containing protein [Halomonas sp. LY9]
MDSSTPFRPAESAFRYANEAIIITNADNCVVDANPAFSELTGLALHEVKGKSPRHSVFCLLMIAALRV